MSKPALPVSALPVSLLPRAARPVSAQARAMAASRAPVVSQGLRAAVALSPLALALPLAAAALIAASLPAAAQTAPDAPAAPEAPAPATPTPPPHHPGMPGHPGAQGMMPHMAKLTVQGHGESSVAPDQATISMGVTTQAATAAQAMADNAAKQQAVLDALRAQGIADDDLQTQGLNLSPVQSYPQDGQPPAITGYQAQNIVSARVRDLAKLGPTLDAVVTAGATDVQNIAFTREDSAEAEDAARTRAVTEAHRRAEVMAAAAGMRLGPLLSLSEAQTGGGPVPMMMARDAKAGASTPIATGQLTLSADVSATWALLPMDAQPGTMPESDAGAPAN